MLKKIINFLSKIFILSDYEKCYNRMEDAGIAIFGCCCGVTGGDATTNNLSYDCISCPHLVLCDNKEKDKHEKM